MANFCSTYFESDVPSIRRRDPRNDVGTEPENQRAESISIFCLPGRTAGKCSDRWLTDREIESAQLHVLLNCDEVKPVLSLYVNEYQKIYPSATDAAVDQQIEADFPRWFRENATAVSNRFPHGEELYYLAMGPLRKAKSWPVMFVNGYKFHTLERGRMKRTYNSGVCVSGMGQDTTANDFYGQLTEILEFEWPGREVRKIVLFYCEWFDPTNRGTRITKYGIVELKRNRRYAKYDPFIFATTAIQVYYCPYPARVPHKGDWWVSIKTKPRAAVEARKEMEVAYQHDHPTSNFTLVQDDIVVSDLRDNSDGGELIFLNSPHYGGDNVDDDDDIIEEDEEAEDSEEILGEDDDETSEDE